MKKNKENVYHDKERCECKGTYFMFTYQEKCFSLEQA